MTARSKARGFGKGLAALDADKNGTVSHSEFLADAQKRYELADTKKDGKVSHWAFRALE